MQLFCRGKIDLTENTLNLADSADLLFSRKLSWQRYAHTVEEKLCEQILSSNGTQYSIIQTAATHTARCTFMYCQLL
jgi:hypothetical protein